VRSRVTYSVPSSLRVRLIGFGTPQFILPTIESEFGEKEFLPVKSLREVVEEADEVPDFIVKNALKKGKITDLSGLAKYWPKISEDPEMLSAYAEGHDLRTLTTQSFTGREDLSKDARKLVKMVNFGLQYGIGAKELRSYALVHLQSRLSVRCYDGRHETTYLRASIFGRRARGLGGRSALVGRLRPPPLSDLARQL
jgi:DNA polymerase family A